MSDEKIPYGSDGMFPQTESLAPAKRDPIRLTSNEPVHAVLELSEDEAHWLPLLLQKAREAFRSEAYRAAADVALSEALMCGASHARSLEARLQRLPPSVRAPRKAG